MTRVVVTRATDDAERLGRRLSDAGHIAIQLPLMAIESTGVSWDADSTPVATTIYIFTSVNAVRHGLSGMTQGSESSLVQVIAVGLRTRIALADAGIQASSPVREDSEGILELLEATYSMPTHAVIIKGEGGRDFLSEALSAHNIQVTTVDCYRRTWPMISTDDLRRAVSLDEPSVVHVASGETLQRLSRLCLEQDLQVLNVHCIVVPSQRVAETAQELGWQSRIIAEGASDEALLRVIAQLP